MKNSVCYRELPSLVETEVDGWTADDLLHVVQRFYPSARDLTGNRSIQALIGEAIRKFPNPSFTVVSDKNPELAAQYLYDPVDAKFHIAKKWGGMECCLQATMASNELGLLRDERFIIPALRDEDYERRLVAIACLAFVSPKAGTLHLRHIAANDVEVGVRQSALWAYGFAGGVKAMEFIQERMRFDEDARVRQFAEEILSTVQDSWFEF